MSNATPNRLGVDLGTTDNSYTQDNALFETIYLSEVLGAFHEANIMQPLHMVKTINSGKAVKFPRVWKTDAQYHTPGNELLGANSIEHTEVTILLDDRLVSDIFIADIDEMKNHYDVRARYAREQGFALAKAFDLNIIRKIVQAARATPVFGATDTDTPTDRVLNAPTAETNADDLQKQFWEAAETLDEANAPDWGRHAVLAPAQYYLMFQTTGVYPLNRDWGGSGSIQSATLPELANFTIHKSKHVKGSALGNNYAGVSGENNSYNANYTNTLGVFFHEDAVATAKLQDLAYRLIDQPHKFGALSVASYIVGTEVLREEAAVELNKAASGT